MATMIVPAMLPHSVFNGAHRLGELVEPTTSGPPASG
jgi:hypothetical protein